MVEITETEFTDTNGQIRKVRQIRSAYSRTTLPDGTIEEHSDIRADEWRWSPEGSSPQWHVFGIHIPMLKLVNPAGKVVFPSDITLLSEAGETILKLGSILMGAQMARDGQDFFVGNEIPIDTDL